jgi:hypothetical protein
MPPRKSSTSKRQVRDTGKPVGHPPELARVVRQRLNPDGTTEPVGAADHVIERIGLGQGLDEVAKSANLNRQTIGNWRAAGARARAKEANGGELNEHEQAYRQFVDALERAETDAEWRHLLIWIRGAEGGAQVEDVDEIFEPNSAGELVLVRRVVTRKTVAASWAASRDFLERRFPDRYRKRSEITGADGAAISAGQSREERAADLILQIEAMRDGARLQDEISQERQTK